MPRNKAEACTRAQEKVALQSEVTPEVKSSKHSNERSKRIAEASALALALEEEEIVLPGARGFPDANYRPLYWTRSDCELCEWCSGNDGHQAVASPLGGACEPCYPGALNGERVMFVYIVYPGDFAQSGLSRICVSCFISVNSTRHLVGS